MHPMLRSVIKPLLCSTLAFALYGSAVNAGDAVATAGAKAAPVPLLWKVSDSDNSVYLLGSFHLLMPTDYPLSRDVDAAFADAEKLAFELSPEEMGSPQLGALMAQAALRTDGTQLDSELPPATKARLDAWLEANAAELQKMAMTPQVMQMFEPWFAGLIITITEMTKMGLDPKLGLDAHLAAKAGEAGKPAEGFETGAEQIAFLDGMSKQEQLQFIDEALTESAEGRDAVQKLHAAWRAGDADRLWKEMAVEMRSAYPQLYRRINVERNDAWVPKIEQRLETPGTDDTLVVVGALHLLGEDGVVEKLRAKGYQVERICSACKPSSKGSKKR
ncbi:TraB/GumN family protein [Luteimonas vadosa]|uniref:TraB/GumN family protein n=1 Tax=Luteimonas vadosa TaxID=1165507 RepID=A0ABP9E2I6_9GAMM